jgi:predicted ester cyclase
MPPIKTFDLIGAAQLRHIARPEAEVLAIMSAGRLPNPGGGKRLMTQAAELEGNTALVLRHFNDFVNNKDLDAIDRNLDAGFVDHDGPGGRVADRAADRAMMARMHQMFPDLHVEVKDSVAQGDKVVVRNLWTGTNAQTGQRVECHGFVMWRIKAGKIVERWATVTPMQEITAQALGW